MKYKVKNKTNSYVNIHMIEFSPDEEKILELEKEPNSEIFEFEELGKVDEKKKKSKGGK